MMKRPIFSAGRRPSCSGCRRRRSDRRRTDCCGKIPILETRTGGGLCFADRPRSAIEDAGKPVGLPMINCITRDRSPKLLALLTAALLTAQPALAAGEEGDGTPRGPAV